ncbi:MAG: TPM domain-containing protein [Cytophagaceae bacterium]|jgi:uncharacterized protein|nr:TPM domain-containing protein [Cytophagaceae bacterium]
MHKSTYFLLLLIFWSKISFGTSTSDFPAPPNPPKLVVDFVGLLSPDQQQTLELKLNRYNDTTSNEISIVIVASVGDYDISDYAIQLGHFWGIGKKKKDNGVLILIAKEDKKIFIATGQGLEGALPDLICKRIIDYKIKPAFKQASYYEGLNNAIDEIILRSMGEYTAENSSDNTITWLLLFVVILIIIGISFIQNNNSGKGGKRRYYGDTFGPNFGGGWYSGGGGWSGGSGGGGFGGFGGGSFGGGGAGGDW